MLFSWFVLINRSGEYKSIILGQPKLYEYSVNKRTMGEQSQCDSQGDNIATDHSLLMDYIQLSKRAYM